MQATSEVWKALWASGAARLEARAIIDGTEYTDITPPVITRALMQDGPQVGNVVSGSCRFSMERDPDARRTYTGRMAAFDGTASAVDRLTVAIEPVQSGSGVPSPENVRPISGWTGANIRVSPTAEKIGGDTYDISWQSEAGTVYGGTLDVTTGLLTVDRAGIVCDGTENWWYTTADSNAWFCLSGISAKRYTATGYLLSDRFNCAFDYQWPWSYDGTAWTRYSQIHVRPGKEISPSGNTAEGLAEFKSWLAANNTTFVYEYATPVTYQLTPAEITLLTGTNYIWADAGEVEAVIGPAPIPKSAEVQVLTRLTNGDEDTPIVSEWLPAGTFYISRRSRDPVTGVLSLECYDALLKANALWEPTVGTWPRGAAAVVAELAALLGVALDGRTALAGESYTVQEPTPGTTVREVLAGIAAYNGGNWILTPDNRLRLVPFAPAEEDGAAEAIAVIGGVDVGEVYDVTGVRCAAGEDAAMIGDDSGIVLDVSIAPVWAADVAERLVGAEYKPFTLQRAVYDPAAELGDAVAYGGEGVGRLCSEVATLGPAFRGDIAAPDPAELADEYPYIGGDGKLLAVAKAYARQGLEALDTALTQQEIFNRLTDNGAAQGMVLVDGQLYVNASYINTGTLTLGGAGNANGVMRVLDADGNVVGVVDNNGVDISEGSIVSYSADRLSRARLQVGGIGFQVWGQDSGTGREMWLDTLQMGNGTTPSIRADQGLIIGSHSGDITLRNRYAPSLTGCMVQLMQRGKLSLGVTDPSYMGVDITGSGIEVTGGLGVETLARLDDSGKVSLTVPLPVASGGTGRTSSPSMLTNLGSTATADVLQASPRPGVTGTLPIANGGTGKTTAADAWTALGGGASGKHADSYFALASHTHSYLPLSGGTLTGSLTATGFNGPLNGNVTGRLYGNITSGTGFFAPSSAPMMYFWRGDGSVNTTDNKMGAIFMNYTTVNNRLCPDRMYFRHYTYNSSTGAVSENWDQYRLPTATANRTTSATYDILTSKDAVTVGQGGTGATTAAGALSNLGIKYKTVTGTTDSNGLINLGLSGSRYQPISVSVTNISRVAIPYFRETSYWAVKIFVAGAWTAVASTSVTVRVVYIDFGSNI